jgi:hypothetical protein
MENQSTTNFARDAASAHRVHVGSCHCGAVRFEVAIDLGQSPSKCNCSICLKASNLSAIARPDAFRLLEGERHLGSYAWGSKTATRYFCKHCGIHVFGRGHLAELGGDYVSVNVNALDDVDPNTLSAVHWDGRHDNWHAGVRPEPWPVFAAPRESAGKP